MILDTLQIIRYALYVPTYIHTLFVQVAENIQEELEDYRSKEDDIKRMKHEMGVDGEGSDLAMGLISDNTQVRWNLKHAN